MKPVCNKCESYGIICNYDKPATELHHTGEGAFSINSDGPHNTAAVKTAPHIPLTNPREDFSGWLGHLLDLHETDEKYRITQIDLDRFRRFSDRTVLTVGTAQTISKYRDIFPVLGWGHSYLTHVILAMVLMHDRHLSDSPWGAPSREETFHHYHGTAIFNSMLSKAIPHEEKDAMWGTAALLGAITIASLDATTADEAWPLAPPSANDLDWLRMSNGKKAVWELANPIREDSIWRPALMYESEKGQIPQCPRRQEIDCLFPFFQQLYQYDESTPESIRDSYYTATSLVIRLLPIQCTHSTILYFLAFFGHMEPEFKALLHEKDPKALLLLAWWYAKMLDYPVWWLQRRSQLECKAICMYLQRYHMQESVIGRLLDFPKMMCGK